jgi:hypothetical protein
VINLEYLKDYHQTPERFAERDVPPPEPIESGEDGTLEYEVDHIKDHRHTKRQGLQYLVSWLNYPAEEDSWEPAANLQGAQDAVQEYWKKEEERKKLAGRVHPRVSRSRGLTRA